MDRDRWGLKVNGCGMDMCFSTVYNLGRALFPEGFGERGKMPMGHIVRPGTPVLAAKAVAKGAKFYGRNADPSGWDKDGGYALKAVTI